MLSHALAGDGMALGYRPDTTCMQRVTVTIINGRDIKLKFAESGAPSAAHNPVRIKLNLNLTLPSHAKHTCHIASLVEANATMDNQPHQCRAVSALQIRRVYFEFVYC